MHGRGETGGGQEAGVGMPELGLGPWGQRGGAGTVNVNRPEGLSTDRLWAVTGREDIKKIKQPGVWPRT